MGRWRLSPLAVSDLEAIWEYSVATWSSAQAEIYHADLITAFAGLADGSRTGRAVDIRAGYLKYAVGSHVIYYRRDDVHTDIIRVLHQSMDVRRHL